MRTELKTEPSRGNRALPHQKIYLPNFNEKNAQTAACQPPNGGPVVMDEYMKNFDDDEVEPGTGVGPANFCAKRAYEVGPSTSKRSS